MFHSDEKEELQDIADEFDIKKYRQSLSHRVLVEVLQNGYHVAFREMFSILKKEEHLKENSEYLLFIKEQLISGEHATRKGDFRTVYEAHSSLANFFVEQKCFNLARHFYEQSYKSSCHVRSDGRLSEAHANYRLGKFYEREKEYTDAQTYYKQFEKLSKEKSWKNEEGVLLHEVACECLQRIYICNAMKLDADLEKTKVLELLDMAYNAAKQGGSVRSLCEVILIVGSTHEKFNEAEKAIQCYKEYYELCKSNKDHVGVAKSYQSLASAYQSIGDHEEALRHLKLFLEEASTTNNEMCIFEACTDIGALYNCLGEYEKSVKYYKKAFDISREQNFDVSCRCEYAIAIANAMQTDYMTKLVKNTRDDVESLIDWKSGRTGFT